MTSEATPGEPAPGPRQRAARARRRTAGTVYATALMLFATVTGILGLRMAGGQDPALGAGSAAKPKIVRKVIVTRRITTVHPAPSAPQATGGSQVAASSPQSAPQPVQSAPAAQPVQSVQPAPAPQPVQPAPAPQPAPVQTSTS